MRKLLFCSVGGSHEPILTAISEINPDYTYFICSHDKDGSMSSESMIIGKGKVIKKCRHDEKPSLFNIPTQLGLGEEFFNIIYVEPDDIDNVTLETDKVIKAELDAKNNIVIYADYTGGTKSMSVGLVLAALENNIKLHLVKGRRADLEKVADGTQCGFPAGVERVRFNRELKNRLSGWDEYAYGQSKNSLERMERPSQLDLQQQLIRAINLSKAFDAWDRFDHDMAYQLLANFRRDIGRANPGYLSSLDLLRSDKPASEPARIYDLWLNALRRSHNGRYDDAVARVYRVIEWIAQWLLRKEFNVETSDLPSDFIPEGIIIYPDHHGKFRSPLSQSWKLLEHKSQGPLGDFIRQNSNALMTPLKIRNKSILAHSFKPVDEVSWSLVKGWFIDNLHVPFLNEAKKSGLKKPLEQLPRSYI